MSFQIEAAVRAALIDGYSADPAEVADKVLGEVPTSDLRAVLASVLPTYVSTRLTLYRREMLNPSPTSNPSRKSNYAALLAPVRGIEGWQFLKDCTRDDLLRLVEQRRSRASALSMMADRYERLAELLHHRNARVVADLSEKDLQAVFG